MEGDFFFPNFSFFIHHSNEEGVYLCLDLTSTKVRNSIFLLRGPVLNVNDVNKSLI